MHRRPPDSLAALAPALATAAQNVLDAWQQDADGVDAELGTGGACDQVASALVGVLAAHGFEALLSGTDFEGGHAFALALVDGAAWEVDVPARLYETGYGYVWRKRPDVLLDSSSLSFAFLADGLTPTTFADLYGAP